jgi:hypothetical protein
MLPFYQAIRNLTGVIQIIEDGSTCSVFWNYSRTSAPTYMLQWLLIDVIVSLRLHITKPETGEDYHKDHIHRHKKINTNNLYTCIVEYPGVKIWQKLPLSRLGPSCRALFWGNKMADSLWLWHHVMGATSEQIMINRGCLHKSAIFPP